MENSETLYDISCDWEWSLNHSQPEWWWTWTRPPLHFPHPTEEELDAVPENFRCYVCQKLLPKREYGGRLADRRVCRWCYLYLNDWDVGSLIAYDRSLGLEGKSHYRAFQSESHLPRRIWEEWRIPLPFGIRLTEWFGYEPET